MGPGFKKLVFEFDTSTDARAFADEHADHDYLVVSHRVVELASLPEYIEEIMLSAQRHHGTWVKS